MLWCHGGCFGGGSIEYDKELRTYLAVNNICKVVPVDFCLTDWKIAFTDIMTAIEKHEDEILILGGISSGGLLAHIVANWFHLPALLICPVLNPATRHDTLPSDLQAKQLQFFHTINMMKRVETMVETPNNKRYILYGKHDTRAVSTPFESWLHLDIVRADCVDRGHDICSNTPNTLIGEEVVYLFTEELCRKYTKVPDHSACGKFKLMRGSDTLYHDTTSGLVVDTNMDKNYFVAVGFCPDLDSGKIYPLTSSLMMFCCENGIKYI